VGIGVPKPLCPLVVWVTSRRAPAQPRDQQHAHDIALITTAAHKNHARLAERPDDR
jgi:hypothetical protein